MDRELKETRTGLKTRRVLKRNQPRKKMPFLDYLSLTRSTTKLRISESRVKASIQELWLRYS